MITDELIYAAVIGGLAGMIGSLLHLLGHNKMRRKLFQDPLSLKVNIGNFMSWTLMAIIIGMITGVSNPLIGAFTGFMTGIFGIEGYKRAVMYLSEDNRLRELLGKNFGTKSVEALARLVEKQPFIKGVDIVEKIGEIDIRIIPETIYNSAEHLPMLKELMSLVRPIGVKINLIEPERKNITLVGKIAVVEGADVSEAVKGVKEYIQNYINGLSVGEDLNVTLIIAEIAKGAVPNVYDLYEVNTTPTANERRKVVIPDGFLPYAEKIVISAT